MIENEETYLRSMEMSSMFFFSEEEKMTYLVEHLEKIDGYHALAGELSAIREKPVYLKEALQKKIIQCLLHYKTKSDHQFKGILNSLFQHSFDVELEYQSFLEEIVKKGSPLRKEAYLDSLMLSDEAKLGSLFSIQDKIRILAYRYLLAINPRHPEALAFFLNYDANKTISEYDHYFIVEENDWSGQGIINEHQEWILPPFYILRNTKNFIQEGFANLVFIENTFVSQRSRNYQVFGNWINKKGKFLIDRLVPQPGPFVGGKATCFRTQEQEIIDANGNFSRRKKTDNKGQKLTFQNKYSVEYSDTIVNILNGNGDVITELDRKFNDIEILQKENLIRYGYVKGRGGEGRYGYLDMEGKVLIEPIFYHEDDTYCDGDSFRGKEVIALRMNYMEYGLVNRKFETLIPFEYDEMKVINKKYVVGKKKEYYFLFDLEGNYIPAEVPTSFKDKYVKFDDENEVGTAKIGDSKKLIDLDGNLIQSLKDYTICSVSDGRVLVKNADSKLGIFMTSGVEMVPCIYNSILMLSKDMVLVKFENHYLTINLITKEQVTFPVEYQLREFDLYHTEKFIRFEKDGKIGIVSGMGKVVLPYCFYEVVKGS